MTSNRIPSLPSSEDLHDFGEQVARQILACDPPQTWQTVQRLTGLGYGWRAIMHMIAGLVAEDVQTAMTEHRQPDPEGYARRLDRLPAGRPSKSEPGHQQ